MTKLRKFFKLYDFRKEITKWVEKNLGIEYVQESLEKYDCINQGIPIGSFSETVVFLDMIERIREEM